MTEMIDPDQPTNSDLIVLHRGPLDGRATKTPIPGAWSPFLLPEPGVRYLRSDIFTSYGARIYYWDATYVGAP
jgi:hypothetical protein